MEEIAKPSHFDCKTGVYCNITEKDNTEKIVVERIFGKT